MFWEIGVKHIYTYDLSCRSLLLVFAVENISKEQPVTLIFESDIVNVCHIRLAVAFSHCLGVKSRQKGSIVWNRPDWLESPDFYKLQWNTSSTVILPYLRVTFTDVQIWYISRFNCWSSYFADLNFARTFSRYTLPMFQCY